MRAGLNRSLDVENFSVLTDIHGGTGRVLFVTADQSVSRCRFTGRITENRIVEIERFSEFLIGFGVITARCEMSDLKLLNIFATLTERLAFSCSTTGKGFRIPGDDDCLFTFEI